MLTQQPHILAQQQQQSCQGAMQQRPTSQQIINGSIKNDYFTLLCVYLCRSTRFCLRGQSGAPAAGSSIAAALRPCSSRRQHQQPRHLEAAASAGGESDKSPDEASLHLTPEEAAAYDALAAEKSEWPCHASPVPRILQPHHGVPLLPVYSESCTRQPV
jgi:hypothetical protein